MDQGIERLIEPAHQRVPKSSSRSKMTSRPAECVAAQDQPDGVVMYNWLWLKIL